MPIPSDLVIETREGGTYEPLPENVYQVEILDIMPKTQPKYKAPEELETVLQFQFTVLKGKDKEGKDLRGRNIWNNFVPCYFYIGKNGKNMLFQIVEATIGREMTPGEQKGGVADFMNGLIREQLRIVVKIVEKNGKHYNKIESYLPVDEKMDELSKEEIDKATVKPKEETEKPTEPVKDETIEEIKIEDIPF